MDAALASALVPVLFDLATLGEDLTPRVVDEQWSDVPGQFTAMLAEPRGTRSMGIYVMAPDTEAARVASLADQVQEWAVAALWAAARPATWPLCPLHPDTHPLRAVASGDYALWVCPAENTPITAIGSLAALG